MLANALLSALLLLGGASGQLSTKSLVTCVTKQGSKSSASVKTISAVLTIPWYAIKITTSTPSRTTTPVTSTTIVSTTVTSSTTTTLPVETDTFTTTSSETSTIPETITTITTSETTFLTTVINTQTTTVDASAGFIPIKSGVPNSQKRRNFDDPPIQALEERQEAHQARLYVKDGRPAFDPVRYPQTVKCAGIVAIISTTVRTKTASTTRIITAPTPIVTSTTTFSTSAIITETPPHASTTVTAFTTIITTSTSTSTATVVKSVTNTVVVAAPEATYYAACGADNQITTVNGNGISSALEIGATFVRSDSTASAYECCVVCLNTPNCAGMYWFTSGGGNCFPLIQNSGQCTPGQEGASINSYSGSGDWAVSNGNCGYIGLT